MRIFITGATGFIGRHLVNKLKCDKRNKLLLLSRSPQKSSEYIQGDLSDIGRWGKSVKIFKPDVTIHLAWYGIPNFDAVTSVKNLKYGLNLFEFLAKIDCKTIISSGSCWEYGYKKGKITEESRVKPINAFSAAKNSLYLLGKEIAKEYSAKFIWIRFFYVYGSGKKETSIIPYTISCIKKGLIPDIKDPSAKQDFIYIDDAIDAIMTILKKEKESNLYNIGSGRLTRIKDIVEIISNYYRFKIPDEYRFCKQIDILPKNFYADNSKIYNNLGWIPKISIKEGIKKMIKDYDK